jgi:tetratricopeptide (TPR) repeat protein
MNRAVLHAVLIACLLIPALAAGGAAVPTDMEDLVAGRGNGSPGAGGTPLPLFPDISFPQRTLAAREWYERGFAFTNEERYSEAMMAYEQALAADRSQLNAWYYLGDALFRLGRSREALLAFGNATAIDPDFVDAYFYESRIYGKLGLDEEEENALREGLDAADRRKTNQSAPSIPSVPRPVPQGLPAAIPLIAVGIALACTAFRRRIRRS